MQNARHSAALGTRERICWFIRHEHKRREGFDGKLTDTPNQHLCPRTIGAAQMVPPSPHIRRLRTNNHDARRCSDEQVRHLHVVWAMFTQMNSSPWGRCAHSESVVAVLKRSRNRSRNPLAAETLERWKRAIGKHRTEIRHRDLHDFQPLGVVDFVRHERSVQPRQLVVFPDSGRNLQNF